MKYYRDTYAEHPEDRENIEYGVRLHDDQSLVTLTGMYDQMRQLGYDLRYARDDSSGMVTKPSPPAPSISNLKHARMHLAKLARVKQTPLHRKMYMGVSSNKPDNSKSRLYRICIIYTAFNI